MVLPMSETSFDDFVVLLRQKDFPQDGIQVEQLYEGYLKLQRLIGELNRPSDPDTGLAVNFQPELLP